MPSRAIGRALPLAVLLTALWTRPAAAQEPLPGTQPIGRFAADVRVAFPKFKQFPTVATALGVDPTNLPAREIGFVVGAHWYPARMGAVTFGLGGEIMKAGGSKALDPTTEGGAPSPTVNTRFSALSPQISLNFGTRDGYSYISGGLGWSTFTVERADAPLPDQLSKSKTINYGGGARWFAKPHVAFSADLRFYAVNPQEATAARPGYPRMTLIVMSGGIAFR